MPLPSVLLLNGSLRGPAGNTGWLMDESARRLEGRARCDRVDLADPMVEMEPLAALLRQADALVVGTGVYWHGWGSPLQRFLEALTPFENTDLFFAKPISALITMDSVGGQSCARGCWGSSTSSAAGCRPAPASCSAGWRSRPPRPAGQGPPAPTTPMTMCGRSRIWTWF